MTKLLSYNISTRAIELAKITGFFKLNVYIELIEDIVRLSFVSLSLLYCSVCISVYGLDLFRLQLFIGTKNVFI